MLARSTACGINAWIAANAEVNRALAIYDAAKASAGFGLGPVVEA